MMRFLKLLKSHWQISIPSPTEPVTGAEHVIIRVFSRICAYIEISIRLIIEEVKDIPAIE